MRTYKKNYFDLISFIFIFLLTSYLSYYLVFCFLTEIANNFFFFNKTYPIYLLGIQSYAFLFISYLVATGRYRNNNSLSKRYLISGNILFVFSSVSLIAILIKLADKTYSLDNVGGPLPFFPYENIIFPCIGLIYSLYYIIAGVRENKLIHHFVVFNYRHRKKLWLIIKGILFSIFLIVASYFTSLILSSYKTFPELRETNHLFLLSIFYFFSLMPFIQLLCFYSINKMSNRDYQRKFPLKIVFSSLTMILSIVFFLIITLYERNNANFLTEELTSLFPLDHMLMNSPAFSIILLSSITIISSLVAFLASIYQRSYYQIHDLYD